MCGLAPRMGVAQHYHSIVVWRAYGNLAMAGSSKKVGVVVRRLVRLGRVRTLQQPFISNDVCELAEGPDGRVSQPCQRIIRSQQRPREERV